ncbi:MAG: DUF2269 family protein [Thiotrichaceae bacterium]|nr:DUF2269 family protein [Thiotrichaceae bacterium]
MRSLVKNEHITNWFVWVMALYILMGVCWIPVVFLQIKMQKMAEQAQAEGKVAIKV